MMLILILRTTNQVVESDVTSGLRLDRTVTYSFGITGSRLQSKEERRERVNF